MTTKSFLQVLRQFFQPDSERKKDERKVFFLNNFQLFTKINKNKVFIYKTKTVYNKLFLKSFFHRRFP